MQDTSEERSANVVRRNQDRSSKYKDAFQDRSSKDAPQECSPECRCTWRPFCRSSQDQPRTLLGVQECNSRTFL